MFMVNKDYHFRVIRIRSPDSDFPWRRSVPSECCCVLNVVVFKYASYNQRLGSLGHDFFCRKAPCRVRSQLDWNPKYSVGSSLSW